MPCGIGRYAVALSVGLLTILAGAPPPCKSVQLAVGVLAIFPNFCFATRPNEDEEDFLLNNDPQEAAGGSIATTLGSDAMTKYINKSRFQEKGQGLDSELDPELQDSSSQRPAASAEKHHNAGHGEPESEEEKIGFGLSLSLFATIIWDMFLLYMLMNPDPQVKSYSIKTVNTCMIIFMALSIEHSMTGHPVFGIDLPSMAPIFFSICWAIVCGLALCFPHAQGHNNLAAALALTSHILAFLGMTTFKRELKQLRKTTSKWGLWNSYFTEACVLALIGICFKVAIILSVKVIKMLLPQEEAEAGPPHEAIHHSATIPKDPGHEHYAAESNTGSATETAVSSAEPATEAAAVIAPASAATDEAHTSAHSTEEVLEELEESLTDAVSIFLSYLVKELILSCTFKFYSVPEKVSLKDKRFKYADEMRSCLLTVFCIVVSLYVALPIVSRSLHGYRVTLVFLSFLTAWISAGFVRWAVCYFILEEACLRIVTAVICSVFCCIGLVVVDKLADMRMMVEENAEELIVVFGFMIGCSWEKAFDQSAHEIITHMDWEKFDAMGDVETLVLSVILVTIMFPGWRLLVLPAALKPTPPRDFKGA